MKGIKPIQLLASGLSSETCLFGSSMDSFDICVVSSDQLNTPFALSVQLRYWWARSMVSCPPQSASRGKGISKSISSIKPCLSYWKDFNTAL